MTDEGSPVPYRAFTVDEANALLPDLEEVFRHLEGLRERMRADTDRLQVLDLLWGVELKSPSNPDRGEFLERRSSVRETMALVEDVVRKEFLDRGIRFPPGGLEHGLLDFPTTYQGRWVFLCWRRGEESVQAWHELDGGFQGRRPLTEEQALVMGRETGEEGSGPSHPWE